MVDAGYMHASHRNNTTVWYSLNMERYESFINAMGGKSVRRRKPVKQETKGKDSNHVYNRDVATGVKLFEQMQHFAHHNHGVIPVEYHEPSFICETCGNGSDGITYEHPQTGACFVCGADDWIDATCWHADIRGAQYVKIMTRLGK